MRWPRAGPRLARAMHLPRIGTGTILASTEKDSITETMRNRLTMFGQSSHFESAKMVNDLLTRSNSERARAGRRRRPRALRGRAGRPPLSQPSRRAGARQKPSHGPEWRACALMAGDLAPAPWDPAPIVKRLAMRDCRNGADAGYPNLSDAGPRTFGQNRNQARPAGNVKSQG